MELVATAFVKVKERWKVVGKKWKEQCIEAFPFVIFTCLLHNFLIKFSEVLLDDNVELWSNIELPEFVLIKFSEVLLEENVELWSNIELPEFDGEDDKYGNRTWDALALHLSRLSQTV
ncbi:Hypothetical predicted protein [Olea europaea subsp. europaea]|uniref:Uncharacterized protein n=1 Tax=Olea europaea subsp. europaea TaxID=158383 RepID=A0A8S0UUQ9_OLEEU|nr:Hypothetical predicted protein [Olea europaea subsp. europaea]